LSLRDPDLGRDRATAALGRRDWGWFNPADGPARAEREDGQPPWGTTRHVTGHDRFDRTLGIPDRDTPMWPPPGGTLDFSGATTAERADAICDELSAEPVPAWRWPDPAGCVAVLADAAPAVLGRDPDTQAALLAAAARRHHLDPATARDLAVGVGSLVAQTTHRRPPPLPGTASVNLLAGARLEAATQLFLARERIRLATALSDPDLPRLWILANGLTHAVPAAVMRRVPARSTGPAARLLPAHDDLLDWAGIGPAIDHLRDVVRAAAEGRRWLHAARHDRIDDLALTVGVIGLTRPATAAQLAAWGPARIGLDTLRDLAGPAPQRLLDLSDVALKAVCDRNGWLLGSPAERTMRELLERDATVPADRRAELAAGRAGAADGFGGAGIDDAGLDAAAFRKNPPAADVVAAERLLGEAGREALRRFADGGPPRRASFADALAHRFPDRVGRDALREPEPSGLLGTTPPTPAFGTPQPQTLDLGL
jgi:hypothetical protein